MKTLRFLTIVSAVMLCAVICLPLTVKVVSAGPVDSERTRRNDLLDREKELLRRGDSLSRDIFELKQALNELAKKLSFAQADIEKANQDLVTVRMLLAA